ncbi:hypothetical protein VNI00_009760 [Paramarasmius palmivorus]|uniref:ABC transporter domain-containing protein n=1 Tax=Paramarasmius palmivorus TaxID=297713 RepID=A0AAW0CPE5_9AGAR
MYLSPNTILMDSKPMKETSSEECDGLETVHLGVYRIYLEKEKFDPLNFKLDTLIFIRDKWLRTARIIWRFLRDVLPLAPAPIVLLIGSQIWHGIQSAVLAGLENRILQIIERGLTTRNVDTSAIVQAIVARVTFVILSSFIVNRSLTINSLVHSRIVHFYDDIIVTSRLRMDLPMMQANLSFDHLSSKAAEEMFHHTLYFLSSVAQVLGHLGLIFIAVRTGNYGYVFAALCLLRPALLLLGRQIVFTRPRVVEAINASFLRMHALKGLVDQKYKRDIISGNIIDYLINGYRQARKALGDTPITSAETQYHSGSSMITHIMTELSGDIPVIYYAAIAALNPTNLSLASIATVQQSSSLLQITFVSMQFALDMLERDASQVQQIYDLQAMAKSIKDGRLAYPNGKESDKGIAFELRYRVLKYVDRSRLNRRRRNVSFSYPGSNNKALDDVSLRIEAGEMIVVVGANGSGKSTFVNILTRLYDATSGEVRVDGEDIKDYRLPDLRQAMGTLTQDHHLYPLSIGENIGLGHVEHVDNTDMVVEAARTGGAEKLIKKLPSGYDTVLEPRLIQYGALVNEGSNTPLATKLKRLKKTSGVSGGERQRLVAARTFMRLNSDKIKFLAVDEPTSALDPEGELELFNNLRAARKGRTMLFITHRFGPLTQHADRIVCMKEGRIVESGSHATLMELKGEYCKMFNIQAKAFEAAVNDAQVEAP